MQIVNIPIPFGGGKQRPNRIVVHAMGEYIDDGTGQIYSAVDWLKHLRLSAHALIPSSGTIIRCREDNKICWHAKPYNTNSLGIELLVPGVHNIDTLKVAMREPYLTEAQYRACVWQVKQWLQLYNIKHIDRHSDLRPDRKQDPGVGFPWELFKLDIYREETHVEFS